MSSSRVRRARPGAGVRAPSAAPAARVVPPRSFVPVPAVILIGLAALAVLAAFGTGCGGSRHGLLVADQRPTLTISSGPIQRGTTSYQVRLDWYATDPDGQVVKVLYAVDPPFAGDTAWTVARGNFATFTFTLAPADTATPVAPTDSIANVGPAPPPSLTTNVVLGYHTVVLEAVDNDGLPSAPVARSFTPVTVAPFTTITRPVPTHYVPITTPTSFFVEWRGVDPDGPPDGAVARYAWLVARADSINPVNPIAITQDMLQQFFGHDAATRYAGWNQLDGSVSALELRDLAPGVTYYFAIVAFDEAGAFEPRFNGDTNVLAFRPTVNRLGPAITVFNAYFSRTQRAGGVSLDPTRIYPFAMPAGVPLPFNWSAATFEPGTFITGYRWALDLADSNVADTTVRADPSDVTHWSDWSLRETQATIGPFGAGPGEPADHLLYIEARDCLGFVSLLTLDLQVVTFTPTRPLLVVDDLYGTPTIRNPAPPYVTYQGAYPMEAEQDSFYYARGGFPDTMKILAGYPGSISVPGTFSDFDFDTLDYGRAYPEEGIALSDLFRYRVIAAYTDQASATNSGAKFSNRPMTWLRFINSINRENTLALYLALGGKVWLFGDGTATAIANGYYSRIVLSGTPPRYPYASGDDPKNDILRPGDFLYDFVHLQSQLDLAARTSAAPQSSRLIACLPYLPQYALPPGQTVPADRSLDPRVGPSAQKTLDHGWGGLPRLTLYSNRPGVTQGPIAQTNIITGPLSVTEGSGAALQSVVDTLYLCQAQLYDPNDAFVPASDGYPNAISYYGSQHGAVVWFGFPLYVFAPDQARECARTVLTHLGLPLAPAAARGAHPFHAGGEAVATGAHPAPGSSFVLP